jgi:hypothetical protein
LAPHTVEHILRGKRDYAVDQVVSTMLNMKLPVDIFIDRVEAGDVFFMS